MQDLSLSDGTNSRSFEPESWNIVQPKVFQVQVLQKVEKSTENRPIIPTTEAERLSFVRGYVTTPFKLQIMFLQQMHYSTFYWLYIWNLIMRTIPTNYIHVFLSTYSPNYHLYGSKMIPLCIGVSWQVVLCGLLQLVSSADILSMFIMYGFGWILGKDNWWSCPHEVYKLAPNPIPYHCYNLKRFRNMAHTYIRRPNEKKYNNSNIGFYGNYYQWRKNETIFTAAPLHHFMQTWTRTSILEYNSYSWIWLFAFIWLSAGAFYKQLFRRYIWRLCHYSQLFIHLIYLVVLMYIMWIYLEFDMSSVTMKYKVEYVKMASEFDFEFLAEAVTGPPVIHLLYARCRQEVSPGRDSTMITMSNSILYFFNSLVNYKLKMYIESVYSAPISMAPHNPFPIFYLWPFLFHDIIFGDLMVRVFYVVTFIVEFVIFVITYQILVEVMVCEWALARRWVTTVLLSTVGLLLSVFLSTMVKIKAYVVTTAIASLTEVVIVCWLYPLDRLLDDVHFMNGYAMGPMRKWGLRVLPWYHIYKTYNMFLIFYLLRKGKAKRTSQTIQGIMVDISLSSWIWVLAVTPLLLGSLYAVVKFVYLEKQNWRVLMKPRSDWGPPDHVTRQLRKQFDSREFAGSQAPRFLARHILANVHTPTYRLDVSYTNKQALNKQI